MREELRRNLVKKIVANEDLFPGIIGYSESVIPQIENAILSGQDIILLGERGQAKSRIIRALVNLLDEEIPCIAGCEINDNPFDPICRACQNKLESEGDDIAIAWLGRDARYGEKLATPDIAVADLIGEVDPIKVAEGRYLSDELTVHFGLIPRTNRGIFSINELPDLAERIQVGLFNLMEERDIQIKGYRIRLPLDVYLVASANPGGLHQPGTHHHAAQGPLRGADSHPLSAGLRGRGADNGAGTDYLRGHGGPGVRARLYERHSC